ncbi:MAG TPA: glycosyltransferase [Bacteroidia bacterium]|jgi:glycosyltransferase involved in cell wall biosynthesis|nr:glycosyltransferase [Bacteroidia bacterium]
MNILLVSTYDKGGAAKACMRLHEGLLRQGISAWLLILFSKNEYPENRNIRIFSKEFPYVYKNPGVLKRIAIKAGMGKATEKVRREIETHTPATLEAFSEPYSSYDFTQHPWYKEANIIHLHWSAGFLDYSFFHKNHKPIIWTLHDMNPFTGGCHYSDHCNKFIESCSYCHYLKKTSDPAYTNKLHNYKSKYLKQSSPLHIVPLSNWMADCAKKSSLFGAYKQTIIPNGINSNIFKPYPKQEARKELGIPPDKKVLVFVAERIDNKRKGNKYIMEVSEGLVGSSNVIICGVGKPSDSSARANLISLGEIQNEETLAKIYSAADALLIPSIEDNLPNTALEAILCGTPLIAFPVGGLPDIISHGNNGLICSNISSQSLIECINAFLQNGISLSSGSIRENAVAKYDLPVSAKRYVSLYQSMLSK